MRDFGPPDPNDDADLEHGGCAPARADPLDPLANFIRELQYLSSMQGPDLAALMSDLPVPQEGNVEGMLVEDTVQVCHCIAEYSILFHIRPHVIVFEQV